MPLLEKPEVKRPEQQRSLAERPPALLEYSWLAQVLELLETRIALAEQTGSARLRWAARRQAMSCLAAEAQPAQKVAAATSSAALQLELQ